MKLATYILPLQNLVKDIRVKKSILNLCFSIITHGSTKIYAISKDRNFYESLHGLLNGKRIFTLDSKRTLDCVKEKALSSLGNTPCECYVLHDGCDIRKPYSSDLEHLGQVLSLQKTVTHGYSSFNSVFVNFSDHSVELFNHTVYSNKMPNYIGETTLKDTEKRSALSDEQQLMIENKSYINGKTIALSHIRESSQAIKGQNPENKVCHVLDREFDNHEIFESISALGDTFVIRLQNDRLSSETYHPLTPKTKKISKRVAHYKLATKVFKNKSIIKGVDVTVSGKKYKNVTIVVEWEPTEISGVTYNVVRVTLLVDGKPIFAQPLLLITNRSIENEDDALSIYRTYLLRSKIEIVFRFIKQYLGWEDFQVRDFNSIKNILAVAFFLAGFYDELEQELKNDPIALFICSLANSKGKVTKHFLLKGLAILVNYSKIIEWMIENNITHEQILNILKKYYNNE